MRLSDLMRSTVVDIDGHEVGQVRDVRLVQDGPIQGTFGAGLRVEGLIVGSSAVASRLGYDRLGVRGPWLVAAIARRLNRNSAYVPWDAIDEIDVPDITLRVPVSDLGPPVSIPALREAER